MVRINDFDWWCWLITLLLLINHMAGWPLDIPGSILPVIGFTAIHGIYYLARDKHIMSFPVQVRIGYILLLAAGNWPPLEFIHWIQFFGTSAMVLKNYCPLARFLSLMPWNRTEPLTLELVWSTIHRPPVTGSIIEANSTN